MGSLYVNQEGCNWMTSSYEVGCASPGRKMLIMSVNPRCATDTHRLPCMTCGLEGRVTDSAQEANSNEIFHEFLRDVVRVAYACLCPR